MKQEKVVNKNKILENSLNYSDQPILPEEISRKNWSLLWILGIIGQISWNIKNSWVNTFVYDKIAKDPTIVTAMVSITAVVSTLAVFLIGTWSDRIGKRKPFIAFGYMGWGLFVILFGATEFLPKDPLIVTVVLIVVADSIMSFFGSSGYDAGFSPWTTDISNPSNRGKVGGVLAALPVMATMFGAIVAGIVIDVFDFFPFFVTMGSIVFFAGIYALFSLHDDPHLKPRGTTRSYWHQFAEVFHFKTVMKNKELFWVFVVYCVYFIGFNVYFPYITIYLNNYLEMSYSVAGILQGVGLVLAVFLTIPASKLIDKQKMSPVIIFAVFANFIGMMVITVMDHVFALLIGIFGAGVGFILVTQALIAWIKNLFPADQRGQFEGVRMIFAVSLPMIFGPMISNVIIKNFGIYMEIDGVAGMVPTESLFFSSAFISLVTLIPLIPAVKYASKRLAK